jgi:DNA-binding CsgD family transcriptional regulator
MVRLDPNGYFVLTESLSRAMSWENPRPVAVAGEIAPDPHRLSSAGFIGAPSQRQSVGGDVQDGTRSVIGEELERETLLAEFSRRELDVLQLLAQGLDTTTMAQRLGIAPHTADWHLAHVIEKLHIQSNFQAVIEAACKGLIQL